jgi:hypothetical protein
MKRKRYVVALACGANPTSYLCGWCTEGGPEGSGWYPSRDANHQVPVWLYERNEAIVIDEEAARRIVDEMCARYRHPPSGIRAFVEAA